MRLPELELRLLAHHSGDAGLLRAARQPPSPPAANAANANAADAANADAHADAHADVNAGMLACTSACWLRATPASAPASLQPQHHLGLTAALWAELLGGGLSAERGEEGSLPADGGGGGDGGGEAAGGGEASRVEGGAAVRARLCRPLAAAFPAVAVHADALVACARGARVVRSVGGRLVHAGSAPELLGAQCRASAADVTSALLLRLAAALAAAAPGTALAEAAPRVRLLLQKRDELLFAEGKEPVERGPEEARDALRECRKDNRGASQIVSRIRTKCNG